MENEKRQNYYGQTDRGNLALSQFNFCVFIRLNKNNLCKLRIAWEYNYRVVLLFLKFSQRGGKAYNYLFYLRKVSMKLEKWAEEF